MKPIAVAASFMLLTCGALRPVVAAEPSGKEVFQQYCSHCHNPGEDQPGTLQLGKTRGKDKALLTARTDLPPAYITLIVRNGLRAMPPFAPSDLTDAKLQVLAQYLGR